MIDKIDAEILKILQENARTPNAEIARKVGKAPSAVLERIRKLERKGVIKGYEARLEPHSVGLGLTAFTFVHAQETVGQVETGQLLTAIPGVIEVHYIAGSAAYLIKVRVSDTEMLADLLREIGHIATVRDTTTTIVLRTVRETSNLPIDVKPKGEGNT